MPLSQSRGEPSFAVAGPQYPDDIRWPANVLHNPHLPPSLHAPFYSSARWQLNATRAELPALTAPKLRRLEELTDLLRTLNAQLEARGLTVELTPEADSAVVIREGEDSQATPLPSPLIFATSASRPPRTVF